MNAEEMSLFELDRELVLLFERMEEIAEEEDEDQDTVSKWRCWCAVHT
jgi:hypothetical protein